jgi:hypothetical protein
MCSEHGDPPLDQRLPVCREALHHVNTSFDVCPHCFAKGKAEIGLTTARHARTFTMKRFTRFVTFKEE